MTALKLPWSLLKSRSNSFHTLLDNNSEDVLDIWLDNDKSKKITEAKTDLILFLVNNVENIFENLPDSSLKDELYEICCQLKD